VAPNAGQLDEAAHRSKVPPRSAFRVERERGEIRLSGDLRLLHAAEVWRRLVAATRDVTGGNIEFDLSAVEAIDGATMALLVELRAELAAQGVRAQLTGTAARFAPLVELYERAVEPVRETGPRRIGAVEHVGRAMAHARDEPAYDLDFTGNTGMAVAAIPGRPRLGYWKSIPGLAQRAGADALPIVLLINALVGFAMAFQSAKQLQLYGANLYVADLVGISMTRELAPLMTAIVVAGRSGAGYAAEIGTMKINEEIDALRTLGVRPFNWLVVPRAIAMIFVLPALTLLADFVGVLGGLIVAVVDLDLTPYGYLLETKLAVLPWDVGSGLIKSLVFSVAIVLIACQQGFAASAGAESVGRRTTSTVVASLFVLVLLDSIVTVILRVFHA
jgi:phospholipid/cholesterol/gamma-HCH transport system permease protein